MESITINWHGPYSLLNLGYKELAGNIGIYAIYRTYGNKETLLYIGKTERSFSQRLAEHYKDWLYQVKGKITVRLGIVEIPYGGRFSPKRLSDIESLLITWHAPMYNTSSAVYYRGRFNLQINNVGRRTSIDKFVTTEALVWA